MSNSGTPSYPISIEAPQNEVEARDQPLDVDMQIESENEVSNNEGSNYEASGDEATDMAAENIAAEEAAETEKQKSKAGRKKNSKAWSYLTQVEVKGKDGIRRMERCNYCRKHIKLGKTGTTSQLLRHVEKCDSIKAATRKGKCTINFQASNQSDIEVITDGKGYDQVKCREIIAKMIIAHELPFAFVEYTWFNILMKYCNPLYQRVSRSTIKNDCIKIFETEKEKIKKNFRSAKMISLTTDCWTSNQTIGYMCLTAHYIDSDWKLQKRIISFSEFAPPHTGEVIADSITESLMKWKILKKIGTITLDNASNNDKVAKNLQSNFDERDLLHFNGLFFHVRCCAHILNLIVQDGLGKIEGCIIKIREAVKYLRKSPARLFKFGEITISLGISTKRSLCSDVKTRWNSTHRMLQSALYYKSTLQRYAMRDSNFEWLPTEIEWVRAEKVMRLLDVFTNTSNLFSGTSYPTCNLFFNEVFKVKKAICDAYASSDHFLKEMSQAMFEKFEKYWGDVSFFMVIAAVLDPRFKFKLIRYCFEKLYPSNEVENQIEGFRRKMDMLFEKYRNDYLFSKKQSGSTNSIGDANADNNNRPDDDYFSFVVENETEEVKFDLEVYLEEKVLFVGKGESFDVLEWWKVNCVKFPALSRMARDVLAIPISTVASESAFSAGGRILDDYRSSLTKDMVELLVCGGDWIRGSSNATLQTLQQAAKVEENLEVQVPESKEKHDD